MSMSSRHKRKQRTLGEQSSDNISKGTSARTRPFSYDDIMLRRKNKKVVDSQDKTAEGDKEEQIVDKSSYDLASERQNPLHENPRSIRSTIVSLDSRMVSCRTKDDNTSSLWGSKLVKDTTVQGRYYNKTMSKSDEKNLHGDNTRGEKSDRYIDSKERWSNHHSNDASDERLLRDLSRKDASAPKSTKKHDKQRDCKEPAHDKERNRKEPAHDKERDRKKPAHDKERDRKDPAHDKERDRKDHAHNKGRDRKEPGHGKEKDRKEPAHDKERDHKEPVNKKRNTDQSSVDYEGQLKKRHYRDWIRKDSHRDKDRPQLDKAPKKKHGDISEEKGSERDAKKLHLRSSRNSDLSEHNLERNRKDDPQTHYEEPIQQKKRSRRTELDDDRGRHQPSISSRGDRYSSVGNQDHEVSPSNSAKDKSEKAHPDDGRKRISSNGTNKRHPGSNSGLGGYSPRKRKTEVAPRIPSSANHSPDGRYPMLYVKHMGKDEDVSVPVVSDLQSSQIASANEDKSLSIFPKISVSVGPTVSSHYMASSQLHAIDSIQLTQATRPKRRLYVENLPYSASEKTLMESINSFFLSSGVNYIRGTLPCISCMIHQDKGQALLEFLTPEDASAALSFDGRSFYGSTLKIRRPKDFVEVTTGGPDKSAEATYSICDAVENSCNRIFIGGISKLISSEMLVDIAKAFGSLKAFHFEHNADIDAHIAFLEYADPLVTPKACAGLNGMKLGGQVVTVVQAIPDTLQPENCCHHLYGIPENAKPLMEMPTEILKLKNVVDPEGLSSLSEGLSSLSEAKVEEILEDIRLECTRFGMVKAVNIIKCSNDSSLLATVAAIDGSVPMDEKVDCEEVMLQSIADEIEGFDKSSTLVINTEPMLYSSNVDDGPEMDNTLSSSIQVDNCSQTKTSNVHSEDCLLVNVVKDETCGSLLKEEVSEVNVVKDETRGSLLKEEVSEVNVVKDETCGSLLQEEVSEDNRPRYNEKSSPLDQLVYNDKVSVSSPRTETPSQVNTSCGQLLDDDKAPETPNQDQVNTSCGQLLDDDKAPETPNQDQVNVEEDSRLMEENTRLASDSRLDSGVKNACEVSLIAENNEGATFYDMFETGCILVEFKRAEASCMAAHCLHGRLFSDRIISVEYVSLDIYRKRFPK